MPCRSMPNRPASCRVVSGPTRRIVIVVMALATAGFFGFVVTKAMKLRTQPPLSGPGEVIGLEGRAVTDLAPTGVVHVKAEEWSASITEGALPRGARVRVVGKDGLRLVVEPAEEPERADRAPKEGSTT